MATGWVAWTCLLLAAASPGTEKLEYLNHRGFTIPIKIKPEHASDIRELILYCSRDEGRTWQIASRATPDQKAFEYLATGDGVVYFSIAVLDRSGKQDPPDVYKAPVGLKTCVDTVRPVVQITTAERAGDEVQVVWDIREDRPDWATLKLEYKAGDKPWVPVGISPAKSGSHRFRPPVGGEIALRMSVRDLAGNEGAHERAVTGSAPERTGGPGIVPPPPGGGGDNPPRHEVITKPRDPEVKGPTGTPGALPAGPLPPLQIVNRRQLKLGFDISKVGPSGVATVTVYVTEDEGQTWRESPAADLALPGPGDNRVRGSVTVTPAREGVRYGYYLVIKSRAGLGRPAPQAGTVPQVRVELDTQAPLADLFAPQADPARRDAVVILWRAEDRNLASNPVTLEWAKTRDGPWSRIGDGALPNALPEAINTAPNQPRPTGRFVWQVPANVPAQVYLRLTVRDTAGNAGVAETREAVLIDLTEPEIANVGIEPGR